LDDVTQGATGLYSLFTAARFGFYKHPMKALARPDC
jgi:hypothetical protein